jgi:hypothetical protein
MLKPNKTTTLTLISLVTPLDTDSTIHNSFVLTGLLLFQPKFLRSGQKLKRSVKTGFRQLSLLPVSRVSCRKSAFSAANELSEASPKLPKPVEFLK